MSAAHLQLSDPVADALASGTPVVALESTIITHGMPYPRNVETAIAVEDVVRQSGAEPATIAVLDGALRVGIGSAELEQLASAGLDARKVSRRDIPFALADRAVGGTTVAATMLIAHAAGIEVFATGGIGGVHRGGEASLDVSADLQELARTPVTVVCAGMKSILDLPRTLEYLETHSVAVVGWKTDELPSFYARTSGHEVSHRCDSAEAVASVMRLQRDLGFSAGMVVANPIPEESAMDGAEIERLIAGAVIEADQLGIRGKDVTPWLLERIVALTGSASLDANVALVQNNARVASEIAVAVAADVAQR